MLSGVLFRPASDQPVGMGVDGRRPDISVVQLVACPPLNGFGYYNRSAPLGGADGCVPDHPRRT